MYTRLKTRVLHTLKGNMLKNKAYILQVFSMSMNQETRDNNSKGLKRGADERSAKIHDYLVSKSYRSVPALDKLQEVNKNIYSSVHANLICFGIWRL